MAEILSFKGGTTEVDASDAIRKAVDEIHARRPKKVVGLDDLPRLEQQLGQLLERLAERERSVQLLAPEVGKLEKVIKAQLKAVEQLRRSWEKSGPTVGTSAGKMAYEQAKAELGPLQSQLADARGRLDRNKAVAEATQRLIDQFHKDWPMFEELRKAQSVIDQADSARGFGEPTRAQIRGRLGLF